MLIKYKAGDVARDLALPNKELLDVLDKRYGAAVKHTTPLTEDQLNYLFEYFTRERGQDSFEAYFASVVPKKPKPAAPKPAPAAKPEAPKPEAPKPAAEPKQAAVPKPAEPAKPAPRPAPEAAKPAAAPQPAPAAKQPVKPAPAPRPKKPVSKGLAGPLKRADGTLVELTPHSPRHEEKSGAQNQPRHEIVTVRVDTRGGDVNLDRFNEKYETLAGAPARGASKADSSGKHGKQHLGPGNKQKFTQRQNKRYQPFRKKETEGERLQRLQLEKARKAQLRVSVPDEITVGELAARLKQTAANVIKKLMGLGVMASISQTVDFDTASLVADEFGAKVEHEVHVTIEERLFEEKEDDPAVMVTRPPVVVVMGHVDHGKTSILDAIRKTRVTEGEAGGITQAIGAYQVQTGGKTITFLDTPGHEAFTAMRARGAELTDIAVLVVAADDGVMPQTIESINHAKAAKTTIIVAINKMDKPHADPEHVMEQLTKYELVPEDWGGDTICVPVSALTGQGIPKLLEMINLTADVMELKANPNRRAKGAVIEARLDKGQGPIATILVQNGTLHRGDCVIAGTAVGRVRVMRNDRGEEIENAGPSMPVEIAGLTQVPEAGDLFEAVEDERLARELADQRTTSEKEKQWNTYQKVTLDNLFSQIAEGERKELAIVVKADVQGSAEAVQQSLEKLSNDEVRVKVLHAGVGAISKSDVMLASASNAIIIGFNVRPDPTAKAEAAQDQVEIRTYRVIYDAINDVTAALRGMLAPKVREIDLGRAEVRSVFKISSAGTIAGCYVQDGKITRGCKVRVVRDGVVVAEENIDSLRRFKDDVKEVASGFECGVGLEKFNDIHTGDILEAYQMEEYRE